MPGGTYFDSFWEELAKGKHDFSAHTFKLLLTNSSPIVTNTVKANISGELSTANGYTAGGATVTATIARTGNVVTITLAAVTWNASGGSIGPYRYFVLYNDSHASDALVAFWDAGESKTLLSGQQERFVLQSGGLTIKGL